MRWAKRSQAAIDFISSYGFALLIIAISVYVVLQLGVFNYSVSPQYCYSEQPFTCIAYSVNSIGDLTVLISQSSGGVLKITGAACSTVPSTARIGPNYGNVNVVPYNTISGSSTYYPNSALSSPILVYSGSSSLLYVNCYTGGGLASAATGSTFTGYLWLNYTFSGLPSTYHYVSRAASLNVKYVQ
ncbi:MAG: hypothetical protein KGH94_01420 [Candidatus Micrarchaeota archaeon]|nr:hypothetical protein [Candidatus Micrarchaeota archaeon]